MTTESDVETAPLAAAWEALMDYGYPPPDMCGNDLAQAISSALDCLISQREDLLRELRAAGLRP